MRAIYMSVAVLLIVVGCGGGDGSSGDGGTQDAGNPYAKYQLDAGGQWQCDTNCPEQSEQRTASIICKRSRSKVCSYWWDCRRHYCRVIQVTTNGERYEYIEGCLDSIEKPHDLDYMEQKCISESEGEPSEVVESCENVTSQDYCQTAVHYKDR
jgi:hypothetical protein